MYVHVKGLSLIEVLVTLTIFSIGLLGLGALQLTSMRLSHDASLRNTASAYASDMADRIHANFTEAQNGLTSTYNNPGGSATANSACLGLNGSGGGNDSGCTPAQMAAHDFYEWYGALTGASATGYYPQIIGGLPNGSGVVCIDSTPDDGAPGAPACDNLIPAGTPTTFAIKVWWRERKDMGASDRRFVTSVVP